MLCVQAGAVQGRLVGFEHVSGDPVKVIPQDQTFRKSRYCRSTKSHVELRNTRQARTTQATRTPCSNDCILRKNRKRHEKPGERECTGRQESPRDVAGVLLEGGPWISWRGKVSLVRELSGAACVSLAVVPHAPQPRIPTAK